MTAFETNPLLSTAGVPSFSGVKPGAISPAIRLLIARCDEALLRATDDATPATYEKLAEILDPPMQALDDAWGLVSHLHSVVDTPELRAAYAAAQPEVTGLYTRVSSDLRLFGKYKLAAQEGASRLAAPQRRTLENTLQSFRLAGAELPAEQKSRFANTLQRSAELAQDFSNRLLDATDEFVDWATAEELAGVPADVLLTLRQDARAAGQDGDVYKLSLREPCIGPILQFAHNRALRERLYYANSTRASEFGAPEHDNTALMAETLALRHERARLLEMANHAEVSLVPKMASSPQEVLSFLRDIARRCRYQANRELTELKEFAAKDLGLLELHPWDFAYASEKFRELRFAFSELEVKKHFHLDKVLAGLFEIASKLFEIEIVAEYQATWHTQVSAYRVERDGEVLGRFLLDPFARTGKRGGAWMSAAQARWKKPNGETREALAYLVTNFASPAVGQPALLGHRDVVTLFHEFGHGLHFLLCTVDVPGVAGIAGVEWDAVELPSQLMENFAWEWSTLQTITSHVETGEPLNGPLFDKMCAARSFQSGLVLLRQVELALFDMRVHSEPARTAEVQAVMDEVRAEVSLMPPPAFNRFQNGFAHIFAGGYAAGYYSYLWAEVLSCDAWGQFQVAGSQDTATGRRYRQAILERGGSRPMLENFMEFVGREPQVEALLRQRGIPIDA